MPDRPSTSYRLLKLLTVLLWLCVNRTTVGQDVTLVEQPVRVATFNVSLNRNTAGQLSRDLAVANPQAQNVAAILRHVRPDIVLLNEFDFDASGESLRLFLNDYLQAPKTSQDSSELLEYSYTFSAAVNTGEPSGMDLNNNGKSDDPADAFGFGRFPGQYGMVVLSRFPIQQDSVRTFQKLLWCDMPNAAVPVDPESKQPWYSPQVWNKLRLSSKSHWDVPIQIGDTTLHLLAAHPTPPAFDGPEDRNGRRNHDEIRLWADYLSPDRSQWIVDDKGLTGGLSPQSPFVVLGDLNSDPVDGDSYQQAIHQLLKHPRINATLVPSSAGGVAAAVAQGKANSRQSGNPAYDTADFSDSQVGNLRVDYALPSLNLTVGGGGVFWPAADHALHTATRNSDHHLVWVDLTIPLPTRIAQ